jgi:hypothetical protein
MQSFINENGEKEYVIESITKQNMLAAINDAKDYLCEEIHEDKNGYLPDSFERYPDLELDEFDDECAQIYIDCMTAEVPGETEDMQFIIRRDNAAKAIHPMLKFATI